MNLHKKVMHVELTVLKFEQKVFKLHIFKGTLAEYDIDPEQDLYYEYCDRVFVLGTSKFSEKAKVTKLEIVKNDCYFIVPILEVARGRFSFSKCLMCTSQKAVLLFSILSKRMGN